MAEVLQVSNPEAQETVPAVPDPTVTEPLIVNSPEPAAPDLQVQLEKQQRKLTKEKLKGTPLRRSLEAKNSLRMTFSQELNKLDQIETRETAFRAAKTCLESNVNKEALKLFLSVLSAPKTQSAKGRVTELQIVQVLLKAFQPLLLEAAGAGLNRVYGIALSYFSDRSREVQEAVAQCMCQIYQCSLVLDSTKSLHLMLDPLCLVLASGTELHAQQTAAVTLRLWVCNLPREQVTLVTDVGKKVTGLFLKLRPGFPDLISTLGYVLQTFGMDFLLPDVLPVTKKLLSYFGAGLQSGHFGEKEACRLLGEIRKRLGSAAASLGDIRNEVISALKEAKTNKVADVQKEAAAALHVWETDPQSPQVSKAPPVNPVKKPFSLSHFRTVRDLAKRKKGEEQSPVASEPSWGVFKPKFLLKGSGRYVPQLGYGKLDLGLKGRPSIRDFIKARGRVDDGKIEVFAKSPKSQTEGSLIVPRNGFYQQEEVNLGAEEANLGAEEGNLDAEEGNLDAEEGNLDAEEVPVLREEEGKIDIIDQNEELPDQGFQVEAPVASTEAGNPGSWLKRRQSGKKPEISLAPEEKPIAPLLIPPAELDPATVPSDTPKSSRYTSAIGKQLILRNITKTGHPETHLEPTPTDLATDLHSPREGPNALTRMNAMGKHLVAQSMKKRETGSPKVSPEARQSEISSIERFDSIRSRNRVSTSTKSQAELTSEEDGEEVALEEEREEDNSQLNDWLRSKINEEIDGMVAHFARLNDYLAALDGKLGAIERKTMKNLKHYRKLNSAPPRYKSRIHPPSFTPTSKSLVIDSSSQTLPPRSDAEVQTSALALYKPPSLPRLVPDSLSRTWLSALSDLKKRGVQAAYKRVLRSGDDVYLLRLMCMTGPVIEQLNIYSQTTLFTRLSQLLTASFVPVLTLEWIAASVQSALFFELGETDQKEFAEIVLRTSEEDTEEGGKAKDLYRYLTSA